ncbi:MAG: FAD-dependent oxidoreductase [Gemmatimonadales bacterium]
MKNPSAVVLGGGLSGVATAYTVARAGYEAVTVLESGNSLGGLAGSFERAGHFYPLGYHHILHRDRTLLFFLDLIGALRDVRWRRIKLLFHLNGRFFDLGDPVQFMRFPMRLSDKARFVRLMARAFRTRDWSPWLDRSAAELIDTWAGPGVRHALFERLCELKFELPCDQISGAWLGARLHFREGSAPFGYIPESNWTKVLCDGVTRLLTDTGVRIRLRAPVAKLHTHDGRISGAELTTGERINGDLYVSTVPTEVYRSMVPHDETSQLDTIRYTGLLSVVCATRQSVRPGAYWVNLASRGHTACAIFLLNALNPAIGGPGETCVNFVTHLESHDRPLFREPDEQLLGRYRADFRQVFGFDLEPFWTHVARVPMYSPIFYRSYRNPPVRSQSWRNLYFAGNYRTFPSIVSTGTALRSGLEAGAAILEDQGQHTDLPAAAAAFRLRSMPRA